MASDEECVDVPIGWVVDYSGSGLADAVAWTSVSAELADRCMVIWCERA